MNEHPSQFISTTPRGRRVFSLVTCLSIVIGLAIMAVLIIPTDFNLSSLLIRVIREHPINLLWTTLVIAAVSAGTIQWAKDGLGWRHIFHRDAVRSWILERTQSVDSSVRDTLIQTFDSVKTSPEVIVEVATERLEELIIGGAINYKYVAAYSLPLEQLFGQLSSAAEVAVAEPFHWPLFTAFASVGNVSTEEYVEYAGYVKSRRKAYQEVGAKGHIGAGSAFAETDMQAELSPAEQRYAELRAHFMQLAQRALDDLQITIGERWRRDLTFASIACCVLFSSIALAFLREPDSSTPLTNRLLTLIVTSILLVVGGAFGTALVWDLIRTLRSSRR